MDRRAPLTHDRYIWIVRWADFQHYTPERDRAPAWIKTYTKQLDDDRYTDLPPRRRQLLNDLRLAFGRTSYRLSDDTRTLSRRLVTKVRRDDLDALNHAGLIEYISKATLDQRLEQLYASRAPARSKEEEVLRTSSKESASARARKSGSRTRSEDFPTTVSKQRGRKVDPYAAAEAMTRNGGWQYATEAFREELARFDLNADQRTQLEAIRDELIEDDW